MSTTHAVTVTEWGVRYNSDPRYLPGYVESGGVTPGGEIRSHFTEDECRYIARGTPGRVVVSRTVTRITVTDEWSEA